MTAKAFSDLITFTRATSATYFDATGTLQTAASGAPRFDYNPSTLAAQGFLVEEQRTNLQLSSSTFVTGTGWNSPTGSSLTSNATTAPNGTVTAYKLVEDTSTGAHNVSSQITISSATQYACSFFAKAGERTQLFFAGMGLTGAGYAPVFTLTGAGTVSNAPSGSSITAIGGGWYRCTMVFTATNTTPPIYYLYDGASTTYTGNGTSGLYIWGCQVEAGAFPTSYIPTTTASVTRNADVASVNTLSPWYNANAGTIYAEIGSAPANNIVQVAWELNDNLGAGAGRIFTRRTSGSAIQTAIVSSSVTQADVGSGVVVAASAVYKVASAWSTGDEAVSLNGAAVSTGTPATIPNTIAKMFLGNSYGGNQSVNGWLRRITYYPSRLANATLQTLTT